MVFLPGIFKQLSEDCFGFSGRQVPLYLSHEICEVGKDGGWCCHRWLRLCVFVVQRSAVFKGKSRTWANHGHHLPDSAYNPIKVKSFLYSEREIVLDLD